MVSGVKRKDGLRHFCQTDNKGLQLMVQALSGEM